jgi:hypothetical protein
VLKTLRGGRFVGEMEVKFGRAGGGRLTLFFNAPLGGGGILSCREAPLDGDGLVVVGGLNLKFCCCGGRISLMLVEISCRAETFFALGDVEEDLERLPFFTLSGEELGEKYLNESAVGLKAFVTVGCTGMAETVDFIVSMAGCRDEFAATQKGTEDV